tara:strand:+ start:5375 stop:6220 length:846 start_codon:yes stop_codon:yes gene_type:complete
MEKLGIDITKPTIIIGGNQSVEHYAEDLKRLHATKKYQFISQQSGFSHFSNCLGFYPDYHMFFDPASIPSNLEELLNEKKIKTKIIIPDIYLNRSYEELIKTVVSAVLKTKEIWEKQKQRFINIKNKIIIPINLALGFTNKKLHKKLPNWGLPRQFEDKEIVNENTIDIYHTRAKKAKGPGHKCKLSLFILPFIIFMNFKNSYVMGFDMLGDYGQSVKKHIGHKGGLPKKLRLEYIYNFRFYIPPLVKMIKNKNMNLYCLVEDKYTPLNNYLEYKNIKELN